MMPQQRRLAAVAGLAAVILGAAVVFGFFR